MFLFLKSMEGFYFLMKEYSVSCTCLGMKLGGYSFYNHVQNHLSTYNNTLTQAAMKKVGSL